MQANEIKFRCSSLGHLMTDTGLTENQQKELVELQAKKLSDKITEKQNAKMLFLIEKRNNPDLPEGAKTHCIDVFASFKYGRREEATSKHLDKGNEREEDSITLFSRVTRTFFEKNTQRLSNDFIQGEPDLFLGESIDTADETVDTKTSWSLHTFLRAKYKKLDPMYYWQGQGYMDLTGAKKHSVVFCLVNGTAKAILDEKFKLKRTMDVIDPDNNPEFKKKCRQIEINHIFDLQHFMKENPGFDFDCDIENWCFDIPMNERIHIFTFERCEADIQKMRARITKAREWMEKELFGPLMIAA
jgi:hypothetical protein